MGYFFIGCCTYIVNLKLKNRANYSKLYYFIDMRFKQSGSQYGNIVEYTKGLYLKDGILYHTSQYKALATAGTNSTTLYKQAKEELLISNGLLTYNDAYQYELQALNEIENLRLLLSKRFRHVFIDEYQDCSQIQRDVLSRAFDNTLCSVYRIGDPDQAIYSSDKENPDDWIPSDNGHLPRQEHDYLCRGYSPCSRESARNPPS